MATQINPSALAGLSGVVRRLVAEGTLGDADARKAVEASAKQKIPLGTYLIENGLADSRAVAVASSAEFGVPLLDAESLDLAHLPLKLISEALITKHRALPLFKRGSRLFVGVSDPTDHGALDEIKFHTNLTVEPILIDAERLKRSIDGWLEAAEDLADADNDGLEGLDVSGGDEDLSNDSGVDAGGDDTPVVKFVNKVLVDAIRKVRTARKGYHDDVPFDAVVIDKAVAL